MNRTTQTLPQEACLVAFIALSMTSPAVAVHAYVAHPIHLNTRLTKPKRRTTNKSKASSACICFTFATVPTAAPDVKMDDHIGASTSYFLCPRSIPISFPRTLGRPEFREVSSDALQANSSLVNTDINHIRKTLQELGPE